MRRMWKSYFAFAPKAYQIVWLLLIPASLVALEVVAGDAGEHPLKLGIIGYYIVAAEVLSDSFFLGGICAEREHSIKYFYMSFRGREVMRNVLCMDLARRFVYCMVYGSVEAVMGAGLFGILDGVLLYATAVLALNGVRYLKMPVLYLTAAMLAPILWVVPFVLVRQLALEKGAQLLLIVGAVLVSAVLSLVTVRHVLWRVKLDGGAAEAAE